MSGADMWSMFGHFLAMSMLSIGGAVTTAPEIHRFFVLERAWLTDAQFSASVALAQAAPGPNLLFVPVIGYAVAGMGGVVVALAGILIPSTTLAMVVSRWGFQRRDHRSVRAFVAGMAPVTIGLLAATALVLARPVAHQAATWALMLGTIVLSLRTPIKPVWLIAVGAAAGALGLV